MFSISSSDIENIFRIEKTEKPLNKLDKVMIKQCMKI